MAEELFMDASSWVLIGRTSHHMCGFFRLSATSTLRQDAPRYQQWASADQDWASWELGKERNGHDEPEG